MGQGRVAGKPPVAEVVPPCRVTGDAGAKSNEGPWGKVQASVARCLRTPPYAAKRKDLDLVLRAAYAASATGARLSLATVIMDR